jgi:hypothetical protein
MGLNKLPKQSIKTLVANIILLSRKGQKRHLGLFIQSSVFFRAFFAFWAFSTKVNFYGYKAIKDCSQSQVKADLD